MLNFVVCLVFFSTVVKPFVCCMFALSYSTWLNGQKHLGNIEKTLRERVETF